MDAYFNTTGIFLDLSQSFDTNHDIILSKLNYFGI